MCGIAGIVGGSPEKSRASVSAMLARLVHRGPDGGDLAALNGCVLGHRRLAIVDLQTGEQPMADASGTVTVTFNGEIYGYKELRARLSTYPFRTQSDTEVLLALYREYGMGMASHLPGMFAFALWDATKQRLVCARDRFGEKPFYYARGAGGEFVFASEIKAVLASGLVDPVIDRKAMGRVLQRYHLRPDQTIYENIYSLAPASILIFENGGVSVRRYWELPPPGRGMSMNEAAEELQRLMRQAVQRQLVADVPVGVFLSGGLDSTTVALVASELHPGISSFSFDFGGEHSEIAFAREAADLYGTRHHVLSAPETGIGELLVEVNAAYDEPFLDSSAVPTYLLAREARRHTTVVLTGDGGDELLGGYGWYQTLAHLEGSRSAGTLEYALLRALHRGAAALKLTSAGVLQRRVTAAGMTRAYSSVLEAHRRQLEFLNDREIAALGLPVDALPLSPVGRSVAGSVDDAMRYDLVDYMPGDILTKIDRASMAHSLELRAPFLDVDVAEFLIALPTHLKVQPGDSKIVMRRAYETHWPASIRDRSKQGFGSPVEDWMRQADMRDLEARLLSDRSSVLYDHVSFDACRALAGRTSVKWGLLVLGMWLDGQTTHTAART